MRTLLCDFAQKRCSFSSVSISIVTIWSNDSFSPVHSFSLLNHLVSVWVLVHRWHGNFVLKEIKGKQRIEKKTHKQTRCFGNVALVLFNILWQFFDDAFSGDWTETKTKCKYHLIIDTHSRNAIQMCRNVFSNFCFITKFAGCCCNHCYYWKFKIDKEIWAHAINTMISHLYAVRSVYLALRCTINLIIMLSYQ